MPLIQPVVWNLDTEDRAQLPHQRGKCITRAKLVIALGMLERFEELEHKRKRLLSLNT